jgi:hypothetical protein
MRIERIKTLRRLPLVAIVVATTTIAIGAAVVSRQMVKVNESEGSERSSTMTNSANRNYVTVKAAGPMFQTNQTGQIRPLTQEEAQNMADGIKEMINQSSEGLNSVRHPDGSVSVDLQDRFQNVTVARKNNDGTISQSCVDNSQSASAFFEIDPQLFQGRTKTGLSAESTGALTKQTSRSRQVRNEDR